MSRFQKITSTMHNNINKHCTATADSRMQYHSVVDQFGRWLESREGTLRVDPERTHEYVQDYINARVSEGRSSHTVAHDLAALTRATLEHKNDYDKPKRGLPVKGRDVCAGTRTCVNARIYDISRSIGIREQEYGQLRGRDIRVENGLTWVHVSKGKGGKEQWQLCDPRAQERVQGLFEGKKPDDYIFTREEVKGCDHANLHASRREHARDMYEHFRSLPEDERAVWMSRMEVKFMENPRKAEKGAWEAVRDRIEHKPILTCRGARAEELRGQMRETSFDRFAVMCVSVFCLAHYREDVTVANYLV